MFIISQNEQFQILELKFYGVLSQKGTEAIVLLFLGRKRGSSL